MRAFPELDKNNCHTPTTPFKTPPRILIPKIVKSRDVWKAKADARKDQRKALEIRVRDLDASREHHRPRCAPLLPTGRGGAWSVSPLRAGFAKTRRLAAIQSRE